MPGKLCFSPLLLCGGQSSFGRNAAVVSSCSPPGGDQSYSCRRRGPHLFNQHLLPQGGQKNGTGSISTDLFGCVTPDDLFCAELLACPVDWSPLAVGEMRDERSALLCLKQSVLTAFSVEKYIKQQKVDLLV